MKKDLPIEIQTFIFPDYDGMVFHSKSKPSKKVLQNMKNICLSHKKQAMKEDKIKEQRDLKELENRKLEEKMKEYFDNYYKNLYKSKMCANCKMNVNQ